MLLLRRAPVDKTKLRFLNVLVVEDHPGMRSIIRAVLQSMGIHSVIETADGIQAIQELNSRNLSWVSGHLSIEEHRSIDFIIADWNMPNMSGIELLSQVRRNSNWLPLPFMMLTAENSKEQIIQAVNLGVNDYIVKPFTAHLLEAKIKSLLESKFEDLK